ncbi:hypothetical protein J2W35_003310 [Variovorax boronicumulans]|uniref:hypothetical protein n=1 Tax=Variovorax boronicumulans TaxID=436515 RepID=UPI00277F5681|nr:hypothetical protein [Variovorax boronicumulans]MDQ0082951.1 hypothetical protein [Variovorax boronicumulans]
MSAPPARTALADTYPNPSNAVFRTGIGALWDYVTGLLGGTGNAAEARNAFGIGSVISFRNLLINGNFAINQRSYVSGAATGGANQYTLDRWRIVTSGQNATFGAAAPDRTVTFPAGGGEQVIEGAAIVGGVYTLSWTGAGTAKVNGVAIANGGNTAALPANTNVTIQFIGAVSLTQFELGTVATPFERRHPEIELALCQRYYETGGGELQAYNSTGNGTGVRVPFKVTKRATPTLTYTVSASTNCSAFDARSATPDGLTWFATPIATGTIAWIGGWTASSEL